MDSPPLREPSGSATGSHEVKDRVGGPVEKSFETPLAQAGF